MNVTRSDDEAKGAVEKRPHGERKSTSPAVLSNLPRILLAEDDLELRRLLCHVLGGRGFRVVELEDGDQLLQLLSRGWTDEDVRVPTILVSDIRMPGCSGLEVLQEIRDSDWDVPVILITAFGEEQTEEKALQLGASAVLSKPFEMRELCEIVEAVAQRDHGAPEGGGRRS